jgi:putative transposase
MRWYVAYSLSLRDLEEMMAKRAIGVDHSTVHRWVSKYPPAKPVALICEPLKAANRWR